MSNLKFPQWQGAYQEALLELNPTSLERKITNAEAAIFKRLQELSDNKDHHEERLALDDAISGLRVLKTDRLKFPDWGSK
jgi:hypothetical protein